MLESPLLKNLTGYIDGRWCAADSAKTMPVVNPATGETIAIVPVMGKTETVRAIESAATTLSTPATLEQRQQWLRRIGELISKHSKELGRIITHEHGKPWKEAEGEAEYAASFFRFYADKVDHLKPRKLIERPRDLTWTVYSRPAGVAALITPWNFPLAMLSQEILSCPGGRLLQCDQAILQNAFVGHRLVFIAGTGWTAARKSQPVAGACWRNQRCLVHSRGGSNHQFHWFDRCGQKTDGRDSTALETIGFGVGRQCPVHRV